MPHARLDQEEQELLRFDDLGYLRPRDEQVDGVVHKEAIIRNDQTPVTKVAATAPGDSESDQRDDGKD